MLASISVSAGSIVGGEMARIKLTEPDFHISHIRIDNVGAIDKIDLNFDNRALLSLYAGNGLGKTTLLECMSLLGHLPCFPTLEVGQLDVQPSYVETKIGLLGIDYHAAYDTRYGLPKLREGGVERWLADRPLRGAPYGIVEFHVSDRLAGGAKAHHRFFVLVHNEEGGEPDTPKLTSILSRGDFDAGLGPNSQFSDDRTLARYGLLIFDRKHQSGQDIELLIRKIAKGRTFAIASEVDGATDIQTVAIPEPDEAIEPRSVSYINTDLNDFGRGNDLRESPKDLKKDFAQEMRDRLRIALNPNGIFVEFENLEAACEAVLRTPVSHYQDRKAIPPSFKLKVLRLNGGKVEVTVDREDGSNAIGINFMSAGENEVFFITLMLLNLSRNPLLGKSIILLDEPDLHIANAARELFFQQVLRLTGGEQVVISSHSGALFRLISRDYSSPKTMLKVLYRRIKEEHPKLVTELAAEYDGIYLGKVHRVSQSGAGLSQFFARIVNFFNYHKARVASVMDLNSYFVWTGLAVWALSAVVFAILVLGALLNDFNDESTPQALRNVLFFGYDPLQYHAATRGSLLTFGIGTFAPPLGVAALRLRARNAQRKLLSSIRRGGRE